MSSDNSEDCVLLGSRKVEMKVKVDVEIELKRNRNGCISLLCGLS